MEEEKDELNLKFSITLVEKSDRKSNSSKIERFYEFHSYELNHTWKIYDINITNGDLKIDEEIKFSFIKNSKSDPNEFTVYDSDGEEVKYTVIGWEGRDSK